MLKRTISVLIAILLGFVAGCDNLSPRDNLSPQLQQRLDAIEGDQNTLENNQNAIKLELGRLQNSLAVQGTDNQVQQGWLNIKADGIIIAIFATTTIGMMLFYMHQSHQYKRTTELLAGQIRATNDWELKERIMASAWNTSIEKRVYKILSE